MVVPQRKMSGSATACAIPHPFQHISLFLPTPFTSMAVILPFPITSSSPCTRSPTPYSSTSESLFPPSPLHFSQPSIPNRHVLVTFKPPSPPLLCPLPTTLWGGEI